MNLMKKMTIIALVFMTILYFPLVANAAGNERIIEEADKVLRNSTPIILDTNARTVNKPFSTFITRAANISITRSSLDDGISLVITQNSGETVDVCVFTSDAKTVIGHTQHIPSNQLSTANWTANELGNHRDVLIFMSCYKDITFYAYGTIVY